MSWFARSIANTLNLDEDNDKNDDHSTDKPNTEQGQPNDDSSSPLSPSRGVKEDFSELTKTLSRQFWGVASFLAPPPQSEPYKPLEDPNAEPDRISDNVESDPAGISGLRSDFAEIGGRFRSGISKLSKNIPVSEFTKIASNLLQFEPEEEDIGSGSGVVGVTEEVVAFVRDIVMHPETWLDFPLPNYDDDEDFDLSDAQQEHALAVERLAPRLAALRIELCPSYMGEARFWEIYFVLLHPKLDEEAAEFLSTPQVVKARASLAHELNKRTKPIVEDLSKKEAFESADKNGSQHEGMLDVPPTAVPADVIQEMPSRKPATSAPVAVSSTEVHPIISENQTVDKPVVENGPSTNSKGEKLQSASTTKIENSDEDDGDDWLKEENTENIGASKNSMSIENEDDVSFSDLEENDSDVPSSSKKISYSSDKDSKDWVQLGKNSTVKGNVQKPDSKESNDWLDIDDIEVA